MIVLNKLLPEDIDEKIKSHELRGIDIYQLREAITEELKDFQWTIIRSQVQCQCYEEQLAHIEKRIKEISLAKQGG